MKVILRMLQLFNCLGCTSIGKEDLALSHDIDESMVFENLVKRNIREIKDPLGSIVDSKYLDKIESMEELVDMIIDVMNLETIRKIKKKEKEGYNGAHQNQLLNELEGILEYNIVEKSEKGEYDYVANHYFYYGYNENTEELKYENLNALKEYIDNRKLNIILGNGGMYKKSSMTDDLKEVIRILISIRIYCMSLEDLKKLLKIGEAVTGYMNFAEKLADLFKSPIYTNVFTIKEPVSNPKVRKIKETMKRIYSSYFCCLKPIGDDQDLQEVPSNTIGDFGNLVNSRRKAYAMVIGSIGCALLDKVIFKKVISKLLSDKILPNGYIKDMIQIEADANKVIRVIIKKVTPERIGGVLTCLKGMVGDNFPIYEIVFKRINFTGNNSIFNISHQFMENIRRVKFEACTFEKNHFDLSGVDSRHLKTVEKLTMEYCDIMDIGSLAEFENLNAINICGSKLNEVPESIINVNKLVELRLKGAFNKPLENNDMEKIGRLTGLEVLSLSNNGLTCIPNVVTKLSNLKQLILTYTKISVISNEINSLTKLEVLILDHNNKLGLPTGIQISLPSLKYLSMRFCRGLPAVEGCVEIFKSSEDYHSSYACLLQCLPKLEKLDLSCNDMYSLPPEILNMGNLKSLILVGNNIGLVPNKKLFGGIIQETKQLLPSLLELVFRCNSMSEFPSEILRFTSLEKLIMISCTLRKLPEDIGSLASLKTVNLSRNYLEILPSEMGMLENLECLDLSRNYLKTVPSEMGMLKNLVYLDLSRNFIKTVPFEMDRIKEFKYLNLAENQDI